MSTEGMPRVFDRNFLKGEDQQLREFLEALHSETDDSSGIFGNAWSQTFVDIWNSECNHKTMPCTLFVLQSSPTIHLLSPIASAQFISTRNGCTRYDIT